MSGKKEKKEPVENLRGKTTKNETMKKRKMSGKKEKKEPIENHMKPNNQIIKQSSNLFQSISNNQTIKFNQTIK